MDLQITGQSIEILPTVKDYVEKKFGKLDKKGLTSLLR